VDEPTVAHPVITPRTPPYQGGGSRVPAPRQPEDGYPPAAPGGQPGAPAGGRPGLFGAGLPEGTVSGAPADPGYHGVHANPPYQRAPGDSGYQTGPEQRPYEKRGIGLFAAIAAVLAAIIAVAALVFVLARRGDDRPSDPNVPTLGGQAPTDVRLSDEGSKIRLRWTDPSAGTVSFMVAMGHPGEELRPVATLVPGETSYEMGALNAGLDYCFTVIAVYRGNQFATSTQTCTARSPGDPAPSTSK
jgi:hypothetical protein